MEKPKCPNCGSENVVPIMYGVPTPEMVERSAKGEIKLGGYAVGPDMPDWSCKDCGYTWLRIGAEATSKK